MDWLRVIDGYCERTGAGYWAEPLNALTNAGFLVAAWASWRLAARAGDAGGKVLAAILGLIGVGSWLFHTHAQVWAMLLDVAPIQAFILVYIGLATVRFFAVRWWAGVIAAAAFVPASAAVAAGLEALVGPLNGSTGYLPVPMLILGYAAALYRRTPEAARGLAVGAGMLLVSLFFRTIDAAVCGAFPAGTHFLWHLLNAVMLWWMVWVLVRSAPTR